MLTLALSDGMTVSLWAINLLISIAITVALTRVAASARRFERLEDTRKTDVDSLEKRLHSTNEKLIDERFRLMTHDLNGHVGHFKLTLDSLADRLQDGEQGLTKLVDVDHQMEIKSLARLDQVKDYIRDHTASKADVRENEKSSSQKFDALSREIQRIAVAVAAVGKQVEARQP